MGTVISACTHAAQVEELVLDGNDLGDAATVALASLIRLSSRIQARICSH